jgi:hypothetical protein
MRVLSTSEDTIMNLDLGASTSIYAHRFTFYLPERNCFGETIADIELWVREAAYVLTTITGGATRLAPAVGMWFNKTEAQLIEETTHIVYTCFEPIEFLKNAHIVRDFIQRFARETMQDSVAVEFGGKMHFITDFEPVRAKPQLTLVK